MSYELDLSHLLFVNAQWKKSMIQHKTLLHVNSVEKLWDSWEKQIIFFFEMENKYGKYSQTNANTKRYSI